MHVCSILLTALMKSVPSPPKPQLEQQRFSEAATLCMGTCELQNYRFRCNQSKRLLLVLSVAFGYDASLAIGLHLRLWSWLEDSATR
jgi:hypothetical protein